MFCFVRVSLLKTTSKNVHRNIMATADVDLMLIIDLHSAYVLQIQLKRSECVCV